jgi:hypothetical protein
MSRIVIVKRDLEAFARIGYSVEGSTFVKTTGN